MSGREDGLPWMPTVELTDDMLFNVGDETITWAELKKRRVVSPTPASAAKGEGVTEAMIVAGAGALYDEIERHTERLPKQPTDYYARTFGKREIAVSVYRAMAALQPHPSQQAGTERVSGRDLYAALQAAYDLPSKWWSPSDCEDRTAIRRIQNSPHLRAAILAALNTSEARG